MSDAPKPAAELSALDNHGCGLRVSFYWRGDRYFHNIDAIDGSRVRPLLESIEGDEQCEWPASPPLQQVNVSWIVSDSEHGHVAMLVGAAGKNHWSMCVAVKDHKCKPRAIETDGVKLLFDESVDFGKFFETELIFDVACRVSAPPKWLGSSYRALAAPITPSDHWQCTSIPTNGPGCIIETENHPLELDENSSALPILRYAAITTALTESPATVRWRYAVRWSPGDPPGRVADWYRRHRNSL